MSSSLEILLHHPPRSTSSTPRAVSTECRSPVGSLANHLEQRSITIARALIHSNWTHADVMGLEQRPPPPPPSLGRTAVDYQVLNVSADVDEDHALASVWLLARLNQLRSPTAPGHASSSSSSSLSSRDVVTVLYWRRRKGVWECFQQSGMRNVGGGYSI